MRRLHFLVPALLSAACASVHQQSHTGFHFSGDIGVAASSSEASQGGVTRTISGSGVGFGVAAGGAIMPNLILAGQLWGTAAPDPSVKDSGSSSQTIDNATYGVIGIGPMIKYYFMPVNLYVAATPSLARIAVSYDHDDPYAPEDERTDWGPALRAAVGKEWYISEHWGMGVAGVLDFASTKAGSGGPTWKSVGGGVVYTASFR